MTRLTPGAIEFLNATTRRVNTLKTYCDRATKGTWSKINFGQDGIQSSERIRCGEMHYQERVVEGFIRSDDAEAICRLMNQREELFGTIATLMQMIEELS